MLSLPLVLLSLHALAVYSAPTKDSDDVAVLRRGGMIHGLTLRREEYHQLQKRAVSICGVSARDASNSDCTKRYPSSLRKRGSISKRKGPSHSPGSSSSSNNGQSSSPSQYTDNTSSTQQRQDEQDDADMDEYEEQERQALGNHCDHLVELQVVSPALSPHCPQISSRRARQIKDYLNDPDHNLYLINGKVNLAKGAATKRAMLRLNDGRSRTYASTFDQSVWAGVVNYLHAKASVARTNADWVERATGLANTGIGDDIYRIYYESLEIARAMYDSFVPSQQTSQQTSQAGSGGNSPHSQSSGTSSGVSDPPTETTTTYNGRPLTLYDFNDGTHYYAYTPDGHSWRYVEYTTSNLHYYPPP
ncbi:hypothetical protein IW262DRAFT_1368572 [Armillaria fumosa]|nr:hypothetical protein IW262DRAFT_1368572 [Armillaria fumosa]